jgi:hypothetical protein
MSVSMNTSYLTAQEIKAYVSNAQYPRFRWELLDVTGATKGFVSNFIEEDSGSLTYDYLRPIKRQLGFTLIEFPGFEVVDFPSDRMRLWVDYNYDPNYLSAGLVDDTVTDGWLCNSMGVFVLDSATRSVSEGTAVVKRAVTGWDLSLLLSDDLVNDRYVVAANTPAIDAAIEVCRSVGLDADITGSDSIIYVERSWDAGTSKLTILNDILTSMGNGSIYMVDSVATSRRYTAPADKEASVFYATDELSLLGNNISAELDYGSVPNEWTFVVSQVDKPEITQTFRNNNTSSPTSIPSRGRVKTFFESQSDAIDADALYSLLLKRAAQDSDINETLTFETPILPKHGEATVVQIKHSALGVDAKYGEIGWSFTCSSGAMMSHTVRRAININDEV